MNLDIDYEIYQYRDSQKHEIDFLIERSDGAMLGIEVKAGSDKSAPSFKRYISEQQPAHAIRYSKRENRKDGVITNIPLYLANRTNDMLT